MSAIQGRGVCDVPAQSSFSVKQAAWLSRITALTDPVTEVTLGNLIRSIGTPVSRRPDSSTETDFAARRHNSPGHPRHRYQTRTIVDGRLLTLADAAKGFTDQGEPVHGGLQPLPAQMRADPAHPQQGALPAECQPFPDQSVPDR